MRSESVSGRARRTARRLATIPYPAPAAPSLALCARLTLSLPLSPSSLPLSALASAGRSNSRSNPPSLPPPSAPVLWPSPAPRVRVPPRPPSLPFPGPWVFVPLSPCPRPRCTLRATHLSRSLFSLPPPGALASRLVARRPLRTPLRPSSLFARLASPSLPCPVSPLPLAVLCRQVARTHLALVVRLYAALRLVQCPRVLRAARSVVGHLCASAPRPLLHAAVARPLPCPAFSAPLPSGQREHIAEQFAWQRSLFAPSLCPGPLALSCPLSARPPSSSRAPLPRSLGPLPSVSLSSSSLYPPGIHSAEQHARHPSRSPCTLPLTGALVLSAAQPAALYSRPTSPSVPCPCPSPYLLFVPTLVTLLASRTHVAGTHPAPPFLPCPFPSLLYAEHFARHCVGMSHACRKHAPGPRCVTLRGADRFAATRRGATPCPVPPRSAGGSPGGGTPLCFRPTLAPSCRRGTPPALPCLLCPSALRPARAQCGAIRVAALPLCPLSLPWPLGPVLPPVCSPSLVHSCPPS